MKVVKHKVKYAVLKAVMPNNIDSSLLPPKQPNGHALTGPWRVLGKVQGE